MQSETFLKDYHPLSCKINYQRCLGDTKLKKLMQFLVSCKVFEYLGRYLQSINDIRAVTAADCERH